MPDDVYIAGYCDGGEALSIFTRFLPSRLAHRIALILTMLSLLLAGSVWLYGRLTLIPSIEQYEQTAARTQAAGTRNAFLESAATVERLALSWANWDDTYNYATGGDTLRLDAYLQGQKVNTLGIDFLAIFDRNGGLLTTAEWDGMSAQRDDLALVRELSPATEFGRQLSSAIEHRVSTTSGIVRLARGPHFVTIIPIRTTNRTSPIGGYLVMGVSADKLLLQGKGPFSAAQSSALSITSRDLPDAVQRWINKGIENEDLLILGSDDKIESWGVVNSLSGKPALLLGSNQPRDMSRLASSSLQQLALFSVIGTLLLGLLAWWVVHANISTRLGWLLQSIHGMVRPGRVAVIETHGNDEVSYLARAINHLAMGKNASIEAQRTAEQQLDMVFSQAPGAMMQLRDGQVTDLNAAGAALYKAPHAATLVGLHLSELLETNDATAKRLLLLTQSKKAMAQSVRLLCRIRCRDGSQRPCEITALSMPQAGLPIVHLYITPLSSADVDTRPDSTVSETNTQADKTESNPRLISIKRASSKHA